MSDHSNSAVRPIGEILGGEEEECVVCGQEEEVVEEDVVVEDVGVPVEETDDLFAARI